MRARKYGHREWSGVMHTRSSSTDRGVRRPPMNAAQMNTGPAWRNRHWSEAVIEARVLHGTCHPAEGGQGAGMTTVPVMMARMVCHY